MREVIVGLILVSMLASLVFLSFRVGRVLRRLEQVTGDLDRVSARLATVEAQINDYWLAVEDRIGKIHHTFESGRACRVGASIVEVDRRMGQISRMMSELLEGLPRAARDSEGK